MNSLNVFHKLIYILSKFDYLSDSNLELLINAEESELANLISFEINVDSDCLDVLIEVLKEDNLYG